MISSPQKTMILSIIFLLACSPEEEMISTSQSEQGDQTNHTTREPVTAPLHSDLDVVTVMNSNLQEYEKIYFPESKSSTGSDGCETVECDDMGWPAIDECSLTVNTHAVAIIEVNNFELYSTCPLKYRYYYYDLNFNVEVLLSGYNIPEKLIAPVLTKSISGVPFSGMRMIVSLRKIFDQWFIFSAIPIDTENNIIERVNRTINLPNDIYEISRLTQAAFDDYYGACNRVQDWVDDEQAYLIMYSKSQECFTYDEDGNVVDSEN